MRRLSFIFAFLFGFQTGINAAIVGFPIVTIPYLSANGNGNATFTTMDAADEKAAFIMSAPKTGDITGLSFYLGTTTTGDTLRINIMGVDQWTGLPDGIAYSTATIVIQNTDDNMFKSVTFNVSSSVVRGAYMAIQISYDSYVAGNLQIGRVGSALPFINAYAASYATSWTKNAAVPICFLTYSDGSLSESLGTVAGAGTNISYNSTSTPDERGIVFTLPYQCTVSGVVAYVNALNPFNFVLYNGTNTVLATAIYNSTSTVQVSGANSQAMYFSSDVTLSSGTIYRLSVLPTTSGNVSMYYETFPSTTAMCAISGGKDFYQTTRSDSGDWTDTTTTRPKLALIVSGINDVPGSTSTVSGSTVIYKRPAYMSGP